VALAVTQVERGASLKMEVALSVVCDLHAADSQRAAALVGYIEPNLKEKVSWIWNWESISPSRISEFLLFCRLDWLATKCSSLFMLHSRGVNVHP